MVVFDLCFPLFMFLFPLLLALKTPLIIDAARDEATVRQNVQVLTRRLVLATVVAAALTTTLWLCGLTRVAAFTWPLFFPLFFGLARPLMIEKNPAWGANPRPDTRRSASLTPRDSKPIVPMSAWLVLIAVTGLLGIYAVQKWQDLVAMAGVSNVALGVSIWALSALVCIISGMAAVRFAAFEAEPRADEPDKELEALYEQQRRFRAWSFYIGTTLMVTLIHTTAALLAFGATQAAVWVGSIGGATVGIAGGVFGTFSDLKRVKTQQRLRSVSMTEQSPQSPQSQ